MEEAQDVALLDRMTIPAPVEAMVEVEAVIIARVGVKLLLCEEAQATVALEAITGLRPMVFGLEVDLVYSLV